MSGGWSVFIAGLDLVRKRLLFPTKDVEAKPLIRISMRIYRSIQLQHVQTPRPIL